MASQKNIKKKKKEPVYIIKPAFRHGGLDYLHISLIALVIILVGLAYVLSTFKTNVVCSYGSTVNATCITPKHNSTQALDAAESVLASYSTINTSLALLPYYIIVNKSTVEYISNSSSWLIVFPYTNPFTNETLNFSMVLRDSNLTLKLPPFQQSIAPLTYTNNKVVAKGVVSLSGKAVCTSKTPIPIYAITDPYAPGALQSILTANSTSKEYGNKVNASYYFIFTGNAAQMYRVYGVNETQIMGAYLACASDQSKLGVFVSNLTTAYHGLPLSNFTLSQVAAASYLNSSKLASCLNTVYVPLQYQEKFAEFYNITQTPTFIINCKYQTIQQTLTEAVNYSIAHLSNST